jgi:hypothetical protein
VSHVTPKRCAVTKRSRTARIVRESPPSPFFATSGQLSQEAINEAIPSTDGHTGRTLRARVKRALFR